MRRFVSALALVLAVTPAAAAGLSKDYPARGRALDTARPASDYTAEIRQRPRALSLVRTRAHGFVPSAELQDFVRSVLVRLAGGLVLPASFDPQIRILAAPDFGALCTPDGTLVISIGLLEQIESEDELAFVLGHEIAHAILRHHRSDWYARTQYFSVVNAASLNAMGDMLGLSPASLGTGGAALVGGLTLAQKIYALSERVMAPQFLQGQEDQADALGFDLMVKAGYNPDGAQRVLEHLAGAEEAAGRAADDAQAEVKPSKPSGGGIGGLLGGLALGVLSGDPGNIANLGVEDYIALAGTALDLATGNMAQEVRAHRPARERADSLAEYQFREYRDLVPGDVKPLPWSAPDQALARLMSNYRAADTVGDYILGAGSDADEAARAADAAMTAPTANHAYTNFAVYRFRESEQREREAEDARNTALVGPEPSWIAYNQALGDKIDAGDFDGADAIMTDAVRRFEDSPVLLPKRILIQRALGRDAEVSRLLAQCTGHDIDELKAQCVKTRAILTPPKNPPMR